MFFDQFAVLEVVAESDTTVTAHDNTAHSSCAETGARTVFLAFMAILL